MKKLSLFLVAFLIVFGSAAHNQSRNFSVVASNASSESDGKSGDLETRKETPEAVETPEPVELEKEQEVEVKDSTGESKIKIRSSKNKFEFQQEGAKFSVESNFPLSVNPATRELTVTTPAGVKVVAVLPQQAVDNMLASGIVTSTSGVNLKTESDGNLSYSIDGTKNEKLLGVFDVTIPKNLIVSAQTGRVLTVNQSTFSKVLDFLSV